MIVTGGENVYSIEVEEVLARHPAVVECAVFGVPDEQWVEAVHALVVVGAERTESLTSSSTSCATTAERRSPASRCPSGSSCAPRRCPSRDPARCSSASCAPRTGNPLRRQLTRRRTPVSRARGRRGGPARRRADHAARPLRPGRSGRCIMRASTSRTPASHAASRRRPLAVSRAWRMRPWSGWRSAADQPTSLEGQQHLVHRLRRHEGARAS